MKDPGSKLEENNEENQDKEKDEQKEEDKDEHIILKVQGKDKNVKRIKDGWVERSHHRPGSIHQALPLAVFPASKPAMHYAEVVMENGNWFSRPF